MDFKHFDTGTNDISRRIDKVIRLFAPSLSLPEIYKAIRKGLIKVNNKKTKAEYRITEGDCINIASFLIEKNNDNQDKDNINKTNRLPLPEIIFENEHLLILNKPYNINVHGDDNSLDKIVSAYYDSSNKASSLSFKPGPLHRLDRNTTGLIAFSKSLEGAHWFSENIKSHVIQKKYLGLATGHLDSTETWTDIITKYEENGKSFHTVLAKKISNENKETINDKIAITIAKPIAYGSFKGNEVTLIEYSIKTGRKHQIRAQSALHNHSLLGDTAYGSVKLSKKYQEFYLTAYKLIFPETNPLGLPKELEIKIPTNFYDTLKDCGITKTVV